MLVALCHKHVDVSLAPSAQRHDITIYMYIYIQADTPHTWTEQGGGNDSSQEGTDTNERSGVESEDDS